LQEHSCSVLLRLVGDQPRLLATRSCPGLRALLERAAGLGVADALHLLELLGQDTAETQVPTEKLQLKPVPVQPSQDKINEAALPARAQATGPNVAGSIVQHQQPVAFSAREVRASSQASQYRQVQVVVPSSACHRVRSPLMARTASGDLVSAKATVAPAPSPRTERTLSRAVSVPDRIFPLAQAPQQIVNTSRNISREHPVPEEVHQQPREKRRAAQYGLLLEASRQFRSPSRELLQALSEVKAVVGKTSKSESSETFEEFRARWRSQISAVPVKSERLGGS